MISSAPINYRDTNGDWQPIDNTLVPSHQRGYAYQNKANRYNLQLPKNLGDAPVKFTDGDASVAFSLSGAGGTGSVSGDTATFADALPGVAVAFQASNNAVKETLTLQGPKSPHTFVYTVEVSPGLTAKATGDGGIDFVDASGKVAFSFAPPFMSDSAETPETSYAVTMTPNQTPGGLMVTVDADASWLADPARVWPVIIDPTVTLNPSQDCFVAFTYPDHSYCNSIGISVSVNGSAVTRGLLKFDLSSVPATAQVTNAKLGLRGNGSTGVTAAVGAYKITQDWTNSATWNTYDGTNSWATPGVDFDPTPVWTTDVSTNKWYYWYITPIAQSWVDGSGPNAGVLLKEPQENVTDSMSFTSSNLYSYPSDWPTLTVTYYHRTGDQGGFYTYQDHRLTDRMDLKINVANGNLMLHQTDAKIQGTGLDEIVDRTYNSLDSRIGAFGDFWTMGAGPDVRTETYTDGSVALAGPTGYITSFTKNSSGGFTSPTGIDATLTQSSGTYSLTFLKTGEKYNFNSAGRLASHVDKNGNTISYTYNASNQLTKITDTQGRATTVTSDPNWGTIAGITDSTGRKHQYSYFNYQLVQYTDPAGKITKYTYFGYDLSKITDPVGNETKMVYDSKHRVTSITYVTNTGAGTGPTTTFTYNAGNTVVTDPNGHQTTYYYDALARVTKVVDPLGNSTDTAYTPNSDRAQVTDAMGGITTYSYDSKNNMTSLGVPTGSTNNIMYTDSSHPYYPTGREDPLGNTLDYTYDTKGNITKITDDLATQNTLSYTYTTKGMVSKATDARGNATTYTYDLKGNLTKITYPSPLGAVTITRDALSRVSSITDGKGQKATYTYDLLDRVTGISYTGGASISRVFDDDGNLTSQTDSTGTTSFSYDPLNRLTSKTLPGGSSISYTYDDAGNLTSVTDSAGTVTYTYNAANELTALTEPGGAQTIFTYDANHNRTSTAYPNGVTMTMTYDSSGRLTEITGKDGSGTVLSSYSYSYADPVTGYDTHLRQSMTDTAGNVTEYTYDVLNRLLEAKTKDSGGTVIDDYQYTYDGAGNRLTQTINGTTTSYTYNNANELTSDGSITYSYDANGNLTGNSAGLSLSYNALNQTASIAPPGGSAIGMSYAGDSQVERVAAGSRSFTNSALGLSLAADGSGTTAYIRDNQGKLTEQRTPGGNYYYLFDGLGSVVALTDSNGSVVNTYSYDPYGNTKSSTGTVANPWRFGGSYGAYHDADTGLYKIGQRYYDPGLARWAQQDPIVAGSTILFGNNLPSKATTGCAGNPMSLNRYAYADLNPINSTDPTGLSTCGTAVTWLCGLAGTVGGWAACAWLGLGTFGWGGLACTVVLWAASGVDCAAIKWWICG